jgi:hypothetical protein
VSAQPLYPRTHQPRQGCWTQLSGGPERLEAAADRLDPAGWIACSARLVLSGFGRWAQALHVVAYLIKEK